MRLAGILASLVATASLVGAIWRPGGGHVQAGKRLSASTTKRSVPRGRSHFSQLIDHSDPSLGTFQQFFAYDTRFYAGPGSPVVLFTPGELNASLYYDYLTQKRLTGVLAKKIGGAVILLEHRYLGDSSPFTELTTANLSYMTLENSIHDMTYFAANVELPFDLSGKTNAPAAPWVMVGASYSGALAAWVESVDPGTLWAYQASSAPVEALYDYWTYYLPVQLGMPKNCSKDVTRVVEYMDNVLTTGSQQEVQDLKALFGMESVKHNDDFMNALTVGPALWQDVQFAYGDGFFEWCDYVENSVGVKDPAKLPGAEGVGLQKALHGYAAWAKHYFADYCKEAYGYFPRGSLECFDSYNASSPIFTDTSLGNTVYRAWIWMECDWALGWFQGGPPAGWRSGIVSRLVNEDYWIRQCSLYFPPGPDGQTFGINRGRTPAFANSRTDGWNNRTSTRLQYTNGQYDPWREATVSSNFRPGGPLQSTPQTPIHIVPGGHHGSDLVTENGAVNAGCKAVQEAELRQLVEWVDEFPSRKLSKKKMRRARWSP